MGEEHAGDFRRTVQHAFDKQAGSLADGAFEQDEARARRLVRFAQAGSDARVLDVGCGAGPALAHLIRQGATAVGLDLSRVMLERARSTGAPVLQAAAETLPFRDRTFDVLLCRATLHHVPAPDAAVWEMRRVLAPGGALVVEDVLTSVLPDVAARHNGIERLRDPSHVRMLSVSSLTGLLEEAGFEVAAVEVVVHERELEEWMSVALASEESRSQLRARFERDVKEQSLGLHTRVEDGRIVFSLRHALVRGVKR